MRGITYGEKQRIKTQSLTRISGCSEIAFEVKHFYYLGNAGFGDPVGNPVTEVWFEEGFVGDFSLSRRQSSPTAPDGGEQTLLRSLGNVGVGGGNYASAASIVYNSMQYTYATSQAWLSSITLPVEYTEGFPVTSGGTFAKNRIFKPDGPAGGFATHDTIYCNRIWVKTLNGEPYPIDAPNLFTIDDELQTTMDGAVANLSAVSYRGYWHTSGYFPAIGRPFQPNKPGAGVVDPNGYLSDRKDYAFTYQTTGDLRRYR